MIRAYFSVFAVMLYSLFLPGYFPWKLQYTELVFPVSKNTLSKISLLFSFFLFFSPLGYITNLQINDDTLLNTLTTLHGEKSDLLR